jgi:hypothetical protein
MPIRRSMCWPESSSMDFFGASAPDAVTDDMAELESVFAGQSDVVRKRALRVMRALCED